MPRLSSYYLNKNISIKHTKRCYALTFELGVSDMEGFIDGCDVGSDDGLDVGQSDTDGFNDGLVLGAELVDGDCEGVKVGRLDTDGA